MAVHTARTTPTKLSELPPFRESFLHELDPFRAAQLRSFGEFLREIAPSSQTYQKKGRCDEENTLLRDALVILAELRCHEQECAFFDEVNQAESAEGDRLVDFMAASGVLLSVLGDLLDVRIQAFQRSRRGRASPQIRKLSPFDADARTATVERTK